LALCDLSVVVVTTATYSPSVPAFFWSAQSYFASESTAHVTASNVLHADDLASVLLATSGTKDAPAPEVIVAFINQQLSSSGGSQASGAYSAHARPSALKAALTASTSSLAIPFVSLNGATTSELLANTFANSISLSLDTASCEYVVDAIEKRADSFADGNTHLFLIKSADPATTEACLSAVTSAVNTATSGKFVALLSADAAPSSLVSFHSTSRPSFSTQSLIASPSHNVHSSSSSKPQTQSRVSVFDVVTGLDDPDFTGPLYITPAIIIGLLTVAFLLVILFTGLCCTMAIQAPLRYATPSGKLVIGKEH